MPEAATAPIDMGMPSAPAPAAPAHAEPTDAPLSPPESSTPQPFVDAFSDLDRMMATGQRQEPTGNKPKGPAKSTKEPPKAPEKKAADEPKAAEDKKTVDPKDTDPKAADPKAATDKADKGPVPAKELRTAYETVKTENKTLKAELERLKTELAKPVDDPEKKTLAERVQQYEQRLKQLDEELKYADYQRSDEYKDKYQKPFVDAFNLGRTKTSQLRVTDADGNVRPAKPEDFDRIVAIQNDGEALELADALFGKGSQIVMHHRERVHALHAQAQQAVEEFRKTGAERVKQQSEQMQVREKEMMRLWDEENKKVAERYDYFRAKDGDEEGNKLLEQGFKLADMPYSGDLWNQQPLEKQVQIYAAIRNRAAAFGRVLHWNKQLELRVGELEKELEAYKNSEPSDGDGDTRGESAGPNADSWEAQLEALAR